MILDSTFCSKTSFKSLPIELDCELGPWTNWSDCEDNCRKTRTRKIIHEADEGKECSTLLLNNQKIDNAARKIIDTKKCSRPCEANYTSWEEGKIVKNSDPIQKKKDNLCYRNKSRLNLVKHGCDVNGNRTEENCPEKKEELKCKKYYQMVFEDPHCHDERYISFNSEPVCKCSSSRYKEHVCTDDNGAKAPGCDLQNTSQQDLHWLPTVLLNRGENRGECTQGFGGSYCDDCGEKDSDYFGEHPDVLAQNLNNRWR